MGVLIVCNLQQNFCESVEKLPACALEFTGRVEIWTPTRYLEDTRFRLDEPLCFSKPWIRMFFQVLGFFLNPAENSAGLKSGTFLA